MSIACNGCEQPLVPHCSEPDDRKQSRCSWWKCMTTDCEHSVYDVNAGSLLWTDGHVETLGA